MLLAADMNYIKSRTKQQKVTKLHSDADEIRLDNLDVIKNNYVRALWWLLKQFDELIEFIVTALITTLLLYERQSIRSASSAAMDGVTGFGRKSSRI